MLNVRTQTQTLTEKCRFLHTMKNWSILEGDNFGHSTWDWIIAVCRKQHKTPYRVKMSCSDLCWFLTTDIPFQRHCVYRFLYWLLLYQTIIHHTTTITQFFSRTFYICHYWLQHYHLHYMYNYNYIIFSRSFHICHYWLQQ